MCVKQTKRNLGVPFNKLEILNRNLSMNRMKTTKQACRLSQLTTNGPTELSLLYIPANVTMMAQIGKGCFNHNTINWSTSELRLWETSKWLPALLWSLRGDVGGDQDTRVMINQYWRRCCLHEAPRAKDQQAVWDVRPVCFLWSCMTATQIIAKCEPLKSRDQSAVSKAQRNLMRMLNYLSFSL